MKKIKYPRFVAGAQDQRRGPQDRRRIVRAMIVFYDIKRDELFTMGFLFRVPVRGDRIILDPDWVVLGGL